MTQTTGAEFEHRVTETINQLGYTVTNEPAQRSKHNVWDRISSLLLKPSQSEHRPDIVIRHGKKSALVETKTYPILLAAVIQARYFADYYEIPAIICVPDDAFRRTPDSVREWAEVNDVVLSPLRDLGDNLEILLQ